MPFFWANLRPYLVETFLLVSYLWILSWWIARPLETRGRRTFRYWWPTAATAAFVAAGLAMQWVGGSFWRAIYSATTLLNAPVLLPASIIESRSGIIPPAWLQLLIIVVYVWISWYSLIWIMERRLKRKRMTTIFRTDARDRK